MSDKVRIRQCCETCRYWRVGDQSMRRIGNVGNCVWMLVRKSDFYARTEHAPMWATKLVHQTTSYQGECCAVYEKAKGRLLKDNTTRI